MTNAEITNFIRAESALLGFDACGFAKAEALPEAEQRHFEAWLQSGFQANLTYMERNMEKRMDPRLLVEGCKTIISVALNYFPATHQRPDAPKIARFAYGKDYHDLIRGKLRQLLGRIREQGLSVQGRAFSDSAPIMERYWAWKAGLGWMGKNQNLLHPTNGSYFLLGELLVDLELEYDVPMENRCGTCTRCLQACPTNALKGTCLDASRCLSYLTIEKKGPFSPDEAKMVGENDWVFGCDICQEVCPWNRFAKPTTTPELFPSNDFLQLDRTQMDLLDASSFQSIFSGTCLERTGFDGFDRNRRAMRR